MKKFTDQEIDAALKAAPKVIQDKIEEPSEIASFIRTLKSKYNLHIDMLEVIAEFTRNMLLGLVNPQQFLDELIAAKIPENNAREIMTEINQQIFVPLRAEMRKEGVGTEPPAPPARRPEIPGVKPEAGPTGPPPQSPSYFHLQNKLAAPSAPAHPPAAGEKQVPKLVVPSRPTEAPQSARPGLREALAAITGTPKQLDNRKLLEDHEEPHINLGVSDKVQGVSSLPIQDPTPPSLKPYPLPLTPPANLPGSLPPHPIPAGARYSPSPVPPAPRPAEASPKAEPSAPPRPYAADPYREPIEP